MKTTKGAKTKARTFAPFNLQVRNARGGFAMRFKTTRGGKRVDVQLDFPAWWAAEIVRKLEASKA